MGELKQIERWIVGVGLTPDDLHSCLIGSSTASVQPMTIQTRTQAGEKPKALRAKMPHHKKCENVLENPNIVHNFFETQ